MTKILKYKLVVAVVLPLVASGLNLPEAQAQNKVVVIPMAGDDVTSEVRVPVSSTPFTINKPGSYYFTDNLTHNDTGAIAITVNADDVTIDMMGFVLTGPGKGSGGKEGIHMNGRTNVSIANGTVREFGSHGIWEESTTARDHRVVNVRVFNNKNDGIRLSGLDHRLSACNAQGNGDTGLYSTGMIINSTAAENGLHGIHSGTGSILINNIVRSNFRYGIFATGHSSLVEGNTVFENNVNNGSFGAGISINFSSRIVGNTLWNNKQKGIYLGGGGNIIESNHIKGSNIGIFFEHSDNAYRNNTAVGNTTAYGGGVFGSVTDGGGNLSY